MISIVSANRYKSMTHSFRLSIFLDFYRFHRFISEETSAHQNIKTEFMQTVNLLTMGGSWESQYQTFITYCLSNITYKEIFKNILSYQSIKITWLLTIFINTDFYWLTTLGINDPKTKNWLHHTWNVALVTVVLFYGTIFLRNYAHQIP